MLHNYSLERLVRYKYSSLLGKFISYKENQPQGLYLFHIIIFITYEWANKLESWKYIGWKGLTGTNTPAYLVHK
jgi:hypothetical protein